MKYLGTGHLELGPHLFSNTTFYEATRSTPWSSIAQAHDIELIEETCLTFVDIVFELTEIPNERFIFPKEALVSLSVENGPIEVNHTHTYINKQKTYLSMIVACIFCHTFRYNRWIL